MLLAVDLDRDEVLVEVGGELGIAEALARHHVAPVAGGVADRDEHRHVAAGGLGEGLLAPRPPVDGIVGVRAQVGTHSVREPVRHSAQPMSTHAPVAVTYIGGPTALARVGGTAHRHRSDLRRAADLRRPGRVAARQDRRPRHPARRRSGPSTSCCSRTTSTRTTSTAAGLELIATRPADAQHARGGDRALGRLGGRPRRTGSRTASARSTVTAVPALHGPPGIRCRSSARSSASCSRAPGEPTVYVSGDNASLAAGRADRRALRARSTSPCCSPAPRAFPAIDAALTLTSPDAATGRPHPRRAARGRPAHRGLGALQRDPRRPRGGVRRRRASPSCWSRPRAASASSSEAARARSAPSSGWPPDALTAVERVDRGHLVGGQLEAEDVEVLGHALARVRLREHDDARSAGASG